MDFLNFAKIVELPAGVVEWLGPTFSMFLQFALNVMAIAIILLVAFRFAMIGVNSIMAFKDGGDDNGAEIVKGALRAMGATALAGVLGFVLAVKGVPWLLEFGMATSSAALSDPNLKQGAIDAFFEDLPFLGVIFGAIKTFATYGVVVIGGILVVWTAIEALRKVKYESGSGGGQFGPVQGALRRVFFIMVLTIIAYAAVSVGPDLLFSYLDGLKGQLSGPALLTP